LIFASLKQILVRFFIYKHSFSGHFQFDPFLYKIGSIYWKRGVKKFI